MKEENIQAKVSETTEMVSAEVRESMDMVEKKMEEVLEKVNSPKQSSLGKWLAWTLVCVIAGMFIGVYSIGRLPADVQKKLVNLEDKPQSVSMQDAMNGMTAGLEGKSGDSFDQAFLSEMIMHHEGAISMAEMALTATAKPEIRKLAQDIIAAQNREVGMMQAWSAAWFPTATTTSTHEDMMMK